uniref:Protein quiver n=1 Tax=Acrobeloides nanus TaxID=290746 RepID=A0A914CV57_9BILA
MPIYFFGCVFFYWVKGIRGDNLCYRCASEHIISNWGTYLPILAVMDSSATKRCTNESAHLDTVVCKSPCFILNVTGIYEEKLVTYGVLRGCQSTFWSKVSKLDDTKRNCTTKMKVIRKREFHAEYCFCNGDHCQ